MIEPEHVVDALWAMAGAATAVRARTAAVSDLMSMELSNFSECVTEGSAAALESQIIPISSGVHKRCVKKGRNRTKVIGFGRCFRSAVRRTQE